jgi:hypothetical protein
MRQLSIHVLLAPLYLGAVVGCSSSHDAGQAAANARTDRHGHTPLPTLLKKLAPAGVEGAWTTNNISFNASTMLLLTDGRLLVQAENDAHWWLLSPDSTGSYVSGTWTAAGSMNKPRLYYASAVLADGRVVLLGGEYTGGFGQTEDNTAEVYDPIADTWTMITPPGWSAIGDAPGIVLPDGRLLLGSIFDNKTAIWNPQTNTWTDAGNKLVASEEESWVLLPDGSVVTVDCASQRQGFGELWVPGTGWIDAGALPVSIVDASSDEIGPGMQLPDGRAMFIGATGHTVIYTPAAVLGQVGTWTAGPDLPPDASGVQAVAKDAPGVLLPNGHFIVTASAPGPTGWGGPTTFFDIDTSDPAAPVTTVPAAPNNSGPPYEGRMMLLPNGQVVYAQGSAQLSFWTNDATSTVPAPAITNAPAQADSGSTFQLTGTNLNGVTTAVGYGDDAGAATNYPLVRLTNTTTNAVTYARTHDHSTMAVATGSTPQTTMVTLPMTLAPGTYQMVVVANAVPSAAVTLQVTQGACTGCVDAAGSCQTGTTVTACGSGGNACVACGTNQSCVNGACVTTPCSGCIDAAGTCQSGTTVTACGSGGNACVACGDGQTCTNGVCTAVPACEHPICTVGTKLTSGCDPCATKICASDSYCCTNSWDSICVGEVSSICGQTCPPSARTRSAPWAAR